MRSSQPPLFPRTSLPYRIRQFSLNDEKENREARGPPAGKKRKLSSVESGVMTHSSIPTAIPRRQTLGARAADINVKPSAGAAAASVRGLEEKVLAPLPPLHQIEREEKVREENDPVAAYDVGKLLTQRTSGKSKFDYKGKSEQQSELIKQLRGAVRAFQAREEQLEKEVHDVKVLALDEAAAHQSRVDGLDSLLNAMKLDMESTQDQLASSDSWLRDTRAQLSEHTAARDDLQKAVQAAQVEAALLKAALDKAKEDAAGAVQQVASLQDINARVQEYNASLQQYNSQMQVDATKAAEAARKVQEEKNVALEEVASLRGQLSASQAQLQAAQEKADAASKQQHALGGECDRLRAEVARLQLERDTCQAEAKALAVEAARYREWSGKSVADVAHMTSRAAEIEESCAAQAALISSLQKQLQTSNQRLQVAQSQEECSGAELAELRARVALLEGQLAAAELRVQEGEIVRRKLHNTIQELKGNIRVFCRVRPLGSDEEAGPEEAPVVQYPAISPELRGRAIELANPQGPKHSFTFDKVFGPEAKQAHVFDEIEQLVQSALDGYKVCIFAYGQTGSGKTYTMLGQPRESEHRGVIPRSLEQIFRSSQELQQQQGWRFTMQASMLEIYNETIKDLLIGSSGNGSGSGAVSNGSSACAGSTGSGGGNAPHHAGSSTREGASCQAAGGGGGGGGGGKQYIVKHDAHGNTHVSDLTLVEVASWREVEALLAKAAHSRSVGRTAMNEQSSRSHCVFTLRIQGTNEGADKAVSGVLNLIDLAGSERLSRSQATGDRLKETQAINKSLSSLGDVICAIANREAHVPYRNSKLTYLLQPCLGGDAKTLMFVNVAPDAQSLSESLCSLRFASKVNACEIGVPRKQATTSNGSGGGGGGARPDVSKN